MVGIINDLDRAASQREALANAHLSECKKYMCEAEEMRELAFEIEADPQPPDSFNNEKG